MNKMYRVITVFGMAVVAAGAETLIRRYQAGNVVSEDMKRSETQLKSIQVEANGNVMNSKPYIDSTSTQSPSLVRKQEASTAGKAAVDGSVVISGSLETQQQSIEVDAGGNVDISEHIINSAPKLSPSLVRKQEASTAGKAAVDGSVAISGSLETQQQSMEVDAGGNVDISEHIVNSAPTLSTSLVRKHQSSMIGRTARFVRKGTDGQAAVDSPPEFERKPLHQADTTAALEIAAEDDYSATLHGKTMSVGIMQPFLWRLGLQLHHDGPPNLDGMTAETLLELQNRCPPIRETGTVVLASGYDTSGGKHWLFSAAEDGSTLLHVMSSQSGHLQLMPRSFCLSSLLQTDSAPLDVDTPQLLENTNELVLQALGVAKETLRQETNNCETGPVEDLTLISASSEITAGVTVILIAEVTQSNGNMRPRYHHMSVVFNERFETHVELPDNLAWCELFGTDSMPSLAQIADLEGRDSVHEYRERLGYLGGNSDAGPNPDLLLETVSSADFEGTSLPSEYNLRSHSTYGRCFRQDAVTNQGGCGSCWGFAASHAASGRQCMATPDEIDSPQGREQFSVQSVMSCSPSKQGCNGGWMSTAFEDWTRGIMLTSDYSYQPKYGGQPWHKQGKICEWGIHKKPYIVTRYYRIKRRDVNAMMSELYQKGPFTVAFAVYSNFWSFKWKTDVYRETSGKNVGGHAVTLVGYGTHSTGVDYWDLMNSWGKNWGDDGFFKFERGVNVANIESWGMAAADVAKTNGSWMFTEFRECNERVRERGIQCMEHDQTGGLPDTSCPSWPSKQNFPDPDTRYEAEKAARRGCIDDNTCTRSFCNGNGDATVNQDQSGCLCTCDTGFEGETCDSCISTYSGYPTCRLMCTRMDDCNGHGDASGVKWANEFGHQLNNCACTCDAGFANARCNACVDSAKTYPLCIQLPPEGVQVLDGGKGLSPSVTCVRDDSQTKIGDISIVAQCCEGTGTCRRFVGSNDAAGCIVGKSPRIVTTTYAEAVQKCAEKGLELCEKSCTGKGCYYDNNPVWTKIPCEATPTPLPTTMPTVATPSPTDATPLPTTMPTEATPSPTDATPLPTTMPTEATPLPTTAPTEAGFPPEGVQVLDGGKGLSPAVTCVRDASQNQIGDRKIAAQCCDGSGRCRRFVGRNNAAGCIVGRSPRIETTTYAEAVQKCAEKGLELCEKSCKGKGCYYDNNPVWTKIPCEATPQPLPTTMPTEATPLPTTAPTEAAFPPEGVQVLDGGKGLSPLVTCVRDASQNQIGDHKIAAQCCDGNGRCRRFVGRNKAAGCIVGRSPRIETTTYAEAVQKCAEKGLELCEKSCAGKGCYYDNHPVWTKKPCQAPTQ